MPLGASADQVAERAAGPLADVLLEVGVELHPLPAEHVGQQHLGVEPGALGPSSLEEVGRPGQQPADRPALVRVGRGGGGRRGLAIGAGTGPGYIHISGLHGVRPRRAARGGRGRSGRSSAGRGRPGSHGRGCRGSGRSGGRSRGSAGSCRSGSAASGRPSRSGSVGSRSRSERAFSSIWSKSRLAEDPHRLGLVLVLAPLVAAD